LRNVEETVAVLGVNQPIEGASVDELETWLEWWRPSLELAQEMTSNHIAFLRAHSWWPPVTAEQITRVPPSIVQRSLRPNMYKE